MNKSHFKTGIVLLLSCLVFMPKQMGLAAVQSVPERKFLIETSMTEKSWMTIDEVKELSRKQHAKGRCGGFMDVTEHQDFKWGMGERRSFAFQDPVHDSEVNPRLLDLSAIRIFENVKKLSAYYDRFYMSKSGVQSAKWIKSQFETLSKNRTDVTVAEFAHKFPQSSIIATIQGSGENADEIILMGAHEDSINKNFFGAAPGADDDASGVATLLEIFQVLMESDFRPSRTLVFMTYAAEEVGLLGSQAIAKQYALEKKNVISALQFDMTYYPGATSEMTFMTDFTDPELNRFLQVLTDRYVKAKWGTDKCGYACSDHASWTKAGYPAGMPFESPMKKDNKKIHTSRDILDNSLDLNFGLQFAKLGLAYAVELGL